MRCRPKWTVKRLLRNSGLIFNNNQKQIKMPLKAIEVKEYSALLTQLGTNAPTEKILINYNGPTIVWSRVSEGNYLGTCTPALDIDKTAVYLGNQTVGNKVVAQVYDGNIQVNSYAIPSTLSDSLISDCPINIKIYNI